LFVNETPIPTVSARIATGDHANYWTIAGYQLVPRQKSRTILWAHSSRPTLGGSMRIKRSVTLAVSTVVAAGAMIGLAPQAMAYGPS
jgi:hypothetical protein